VLSLDREDSEGPSDQKCSSVETSQPKPVWLSLWTAARYASRCRGHEFAPLRYSAANVLFETLVLDDSSPDTANILDFTIGSGYRLGSTKGRTFRENFSDQFRHGLSILWFNHNPGILGP
jgi:hypothetical protein